jgi:hypothetical protein
MAVVLLAASPAPARQNRKNPAPPETPARSTDSSFLAYLANRQVIESSGLASSLRRPDVLWTHNDSGDTARLFAFDLSGRDLGTFTVEGVDAFDWEDMASDMIDGEPCLVVADTGDNGRSRSDTALYIVEEPVVDPAQAPRSGSVRPRETIPFTYEDGSHDCEAVAMEPGGARFYLVSKGKGPESAIYELTRPDPAAPRPAVARLIARPGLKQVTAMDISADGRRAILLTYGHAYEYERKGEESWADAFARTPTRVPLPRRPKGESVCYGPERDTLYLTSEGVPAPLWRVKLGPLPE